jgi:hypothetical protein
MPTIAIVDGVKIQMFYNDHTRPTFTLYWVVMKCWWRSAALT